MKNENDEQPQPLAKEVELVVTEEDYREGLKRGWTDDEMLKPGRYKLTRGTFHARHPEMKDKLTKRP